MLDLPPITYGMTFVRAPLAVCAESMLSWMAEAIEPPWVTTPLNEPVQAMLTRLDPFSFTANTALMIGTHGEWTAYLDNGSQGTEDTPVSQLALRIGCEALGLRMCDDPAVASMNGVSFTLYGPKQTHWLNVIRHVGWLGERAAFGQHGAPLPFEHLDTYSARRIRDRLTKALVLEHAAALGVRPLDETFYRNEAILFARPPVNGQPRLTFGEWREKFVTNGTASTKAPAPLKGPPSYLRKKAYKADPDGPAKLLVGGAWCGHGEPKYWVYDIRDSENSVFTVHLPAKSDSLPPVVRVTAAGGATIVVYDSRKHPPSVFVDRKDEAETTELRCPECAGNQFRVSVGFEVPGDAESALDTSWFALAAACATCAWSAIAWDDETA